MLETAQQVASLPASTSLISYDQVKDQCEALVTGKHQKMSVLQSFKQQQEAKAIVLASDTSLKTAANTDTVSFTKKIPFPKIIKHTTTLIQSTTTHTSTFHLRTSNA